MRRVGSSLILLTLLTLLTGCGTLQNFGWFAKSNQRPPAPLVDFTPTLPVHRIWSVNAGSGTGKHRALKLVVAVAGANIYTADYRGRVYAFNRVTGQRIWRQDVRQYITAGPGVGNGIVVVATDNARIVALNANNGYILWSTAVPDEVLAAPKISQGYVLVKTINGSLLAYSVKSGKRLWYYHHGSPLLVLRGSSVPAVSGNKVVVGFADGKVDAVNLHSGHLLWERVIATPKGLTQVEQMVDIDADIKIYGSDVFAATYQGNIADLDLNTGRPQWRHKISSYAGLAVGLGQVYVSDAESHIWNFDTITGGVDWRQLKLDARFITGPAIVGRSIVVGDKEGYLHWLAKSDGRFVARVFVDSSGIVATPVVVNHIVYVVTQRGNLVAYRVGG